MGVSDLSEVQEVVLKALGGWKAEVGEGWLWGHSCFCCCKGAEDHLKQVALGLAGLRQATYFTPGTEQRGVRGHKQEELVEQEPIPFWLLPFLLQGNLLIFAFSSPD